MILQTATLHIKPGLASEFESAFRAAAGKLITKKGYIDHELHKCVENRDEYLFFVRWSGIKDHLIGFKGHPDYADWLSMLEPFYSQAPEMRHFVDIRTSGREQGSEETGELSVEPINVSTMRKQE